MILANQTGVSPVMQRTGTLRSILRRARPTAPTSLGIAEQEQKPNHHMFASLPQPIFLPFILTPLFNNGRPRSGWT